MGQLENARGQDLVQVVFLHSRLQALLYEESTNRRTS